MMTRRRTLTNWGAYEVETDGHDITAVHPFAKDPDPSPIGQSMKAVRKSRVERPAIREALIQELGREPLLVEVARQMGLTVSAVSLIYRDLDVDSKAETEDGSVEAPFKTVTAAMATVRPGDTVTAIKSRPSNSMPALSKAPLSMGKTART